MKDSKTGMFIRPDCRKAEIQYPCRWLYKVISLDHLQDKEKIVAMLQDYSWEISISNSSRTGKYTCLDVEVDVESEEQRSTLYQLLKELETVKIVL
jgi:putative lipoic acid-binding regulatory protein